MNTEGISDLVDYLYPIFVAKANWAVAVSGYTVAQRLLDPRASPRFGTDYLDTTDAIFTIVTPPY
jgi:hypothetical protein